MVVPTSVEAPNPVAPRLLWAAPLVPAAISGFCLSALLYYHLQVGGADPVGWLQGFVAGLYRLLGFVPAMMLALLAFVWSTIWYVTGRVEQPAQRLLRVLALAVTLSILVGLTPEQAGAQNDGGILGAWVGPRLTAVLGFVLSTLLVSGAALCALLLATDCMFFRHFEGLAQRPILGRGGRREVEAGVEGEAVAHLRGLGDERPFAAAPVLESGAPADEADEAEEALDEAAAAPVRGSWRERAAARLVPEDPVETDPLEPSPSLTALAAEAVAEAAVELGVERGPAEPAPAEDANEAAAPGLGSAPEEIEPAAEAPLAPIGGAGFEAAGVPWEEPLQEAPPTPAEELPLDAVAELAGAADSPRSPEGLAPTRQGSLFGAMLEPALLAEATGLVREAQRASVPFLQRRLRVGFDDARDLLDELRRRGVVGGELGSLQGPVLLEPGESGEASATG